jgi:hypothetical protein
MSNAAPRYTCLLLVALLMTAVASAHAQSRLRPHSSAGPQSNESQSPTHAVGPTTSSAPAPGSQREDDDFTTALLFAQGISSQYAKFLSPPRNLRCPCTVADARENRDTWKEDTSPFANLPYYHPGAASSFRSRITYSSPGQPAKHGQQCTYDENGNLITGGSAAGTPDVFSPKQHRIKHYWNDVRPWGVLGWQIYNEYWPPNNGEGCAENIVTRIVLTPNSAPSPGPTPLPNGAIDTPYSPNNPVVIRANGGKEPYEFSISGGTLPDGLHLVDDSLGARIMGTPVGAMSNCTFTVFVEDDDGYTGSQTYTIATDPYEIPDVSGAWHGSVEQPNGPEQHYRYEMSLQQTGTQVTGTSRVESVVDNRYYAVYSLVGVVSGQTLHFTEVRITEQVYHSDWWWCMKDGQLAIEGNRMAGPYRAGTCEPGTLTVTR